MKKYVVIYMDLGDSCDYRNRTLGTYKSFEKAKKEMMLDVDQYAYQNNLGITEQRDDFVLVGDDEQGCQWQIITVGE